MIWNRDLEITEDEGSIVGKAKRRASDQQRDPAIDPAIGKIVGGSETTDE